MLYSVSRRTMSTVTLRQVLNSDAASTCMESTLPVWLHGSVTRSSTLEIGAARNSDQVPVHAFSMTMFHWSMAFSTMEAHNFVSTGPFQCRCWFLPPRAATTLPREIERTRHQLSSERRESQFRTNQQTSHRFCKIVIHRFVHLACSPYSDVAGGDRHDCWRFQWCQLVTPRPFTLEGGLGGFQVSGQTCAAS